MLEEIVRPIDDAVPCGADYKYEDEYLAIEAEVDKANSMVEGVSPDWGEVADASSQLLKEKTKDVKLLCWWSYAMWRTRQAAGLAEALESFAAVLESFADGLFPKSAKVKRSSLAWLEESLQKEMLGERGELVCALDAERFLTLFEAMQKSITAMLGEEIGFCSKISSMLKREIEEKRSKEQQSVPAQSSSSQTAQPGAIASDEDAQKVLQSLRKSATMLQEYYRGKESADLRALRLVRLLAWFDVDSLPADEGGKTPLNPPSEMTMQSIEDLIEAKELEEAFAKIETLLMRSPFWLEGHYRSYDLLERMGHTVAAKEVLGALSTFVAAHEGVLELQFRDGTPFASTKMKQWLAEQSSVFADAKSGPGESGDESGGSEEIVEQAFALAKKKKIKEAMGLLQERYTLASSSKERFMWRLHKVKLAAQFGKVAVARALLEELRKEIDRYNLDEWQPELAGEVFRLYLQSFDRAHSDPQERSDIYARLCKTSITEALEINL